MAADRPSGGRVEILALGGIPEIVPGDDLAAILGDAVERTADALPLRENENEGTTNRQGEQH